MESKEAYLQNVVSDVEDLAERVALLKAHIARQKVSVKLQYHWELDYLRNRFAEFRQCVERLENAGDTDLEEARKASELAWKDLQHAIDSLLAAVGG